MRTILAFCAALLPLAAQPSAMAQTATEAPAARPAATVGDLDWLLGEWAGTGIGGLPAGESFARAGDKRLVGHFWQLAADGAPQFYELITIEPDGESLMMRLKHFHRDLTGWEEKAGTTALEFPLRERAPGRWVFGAVTFTQESPDRLKVSVRMSSKSGERSTLEFDYRRLR